MIDNNLFSDEYANRIVQLVERTNRTSRRHGNYPVDGGAPTNGSSAANYDCGCCDTSECVDVDWYQLIIHENSICGCDSPINDIFLESTNDPNTFISSESFWCHGFADFITTPRECDHVWVFVCDGNIVVDTMNQGTPIPCSCPPPQFPPNSNCTDINYSETVIVECGEDLCLDCREMVNWIWSNGIWVRNNSVPNGDCNCLNRDPPDFSGTTNGQLADTWCYGTVCNYTANIDALQQMPWLIGRWILTIGSVNGYDCDETRLRFVIGNVTVIEYATQCPLKFCPSCNNKMIAINCITQCKNYSKSVCVNAKVQE